MSRTSRKTSSKVALCGVISALSLMLMVAAYFPYATFALPALAGVLLVGIVLEINFQWAICSYIAVAVLSCVMCHPEAVILFVGFFGYYPIAKSFLERIPNRVAEWMGKLLLLNGAMTICYFAMVGILGMSASDFGDFGRYTLAVLAVAVNVAFVLYDVALTGLISAYLQKIHPRLTRLR